MIQEIRKKAFETVATALLKSYLAILRVSQYGHACHLASCILLFAANLCLRRIVSDHIRHDGMYINLLDRHSTRNYTDSDQLIVC